MKQRLQEHPDALPLFEGGWGDLLFVLTNKKRQIADKCR